MNCGKPKPKPKPNPQEPSDGFTIGIGCGGSAAAGAKVDGNVGCVVDSQGNFGDFASGGIGGGTPSASVSGYIQITNAPSVDKLAGQAYQVGGSAWIIGLEILVIPDKDTGEVYYGVNLGVSFGPLPEVHGETSFTAMSNVINIPDCIDQILENY
ncbi:hypothetical protein [Yeguia hominis]|uniref:Uncharacterized protein n=1 Tax=Yeguia hominis TaxID=2763662 RepID=A0A926HMX2_9FIRM|nr:hypothetical protein [Yeguia hominis]MBC8533597.1 hypothetical protein [Yeguia hominis]